MFKVTIEGTTMAELGAAVIAFAAQFQTISAAEDKPAPARRRAAKADDAGKQEAEAPNATVLDASADTDQSSDQAGTQESASTTSDNGPTATSDASPSDGPSRDETLKAAMEFGQKNGDAALKDKITAMGATKFSEIAVDKYADFVASLSATSSMLD